jgi:hypothetical protein
MKTTLKILLLLLGALGLCMGLCTFLGYWAAQGSYTASEFGVTNPESAALVVKDKSGWFHIETVSIQNKNGGATLDLGSVPNEGGKVFEIPSGTYTLTVGYHAEDLGSMIEFSCSGKLRNTFNLPRGGALVAEMSGGSFCSMTYLPPEMSLTRKREE